MLKPRKVKNRYQVTKQTTPRTSRAHAVVIYLGKRKLRHVDFKSIRNLNKEVEPKLLSPNGRDDFFMLRRVIKDIFRMTQGEWILSWVINRPELFFHRKFPRPKPFVLSQEAMDNIMKDDAKAFWPTGVGIIYLMDEQGNFIKNEDVAC